MIVDKELIFEAKKTYGEQAAIDIANDLQLENFNEKDLKSLCPFHNENSGSFVWNSKENHWHCFGCGKNYGIIDHYMDHYGMTFLESLQKLFEITETKFRFGEMGVKSKKNYRYPHHENNEDRSLVENYLELRKISKSTLNYCDVQQDDKKNIVFHYYDNNDVLSLVKYRPARKLDKNDIKAWCQKDSDTMPILFNMNRIDTTKALLITEGEIDALSAIESGFSNTVSIPFGAQTETWIETCWDFLEQFEKIIIWSDNDSAGLSMRKNVCARLGSWRTYYVDLPLVVEDKRVKDINEILYHFGKSAVMQYIENANEIPLEDFEDLADVEMLDLANEQGIYTGINEFDKYVNKLYFGNVVIWTGINSSGKSVQVNQIAVAEPLNQGYDVGVFSLENPNRMFKAWINRMLAGREYVKMIDETTPSIPKDVVNQINEWYRGRVHMYKNNINYQSNFILQKMEELVRKKGVKSIVIDNFMMVDVGDGVQLNENQKELIKKLVLFAKNHYCLVHLVAHPKKIAKGTELVKDDISGTGNITNLAQYVFAVKRYTPEQKEGKMNEKGGYYKGCEPIEHDTCTTILKNRITGVQDKAIKMYFDYPSYRFYTNSKELYKRYKWNKDNSALPNDNPKGKKYDFLERNG